MSGDDVNPSRRRFLTAATTVIGGVGTAFALVPFVSSMQPSAKARAAGAPVLADISKLEDGQMIRVKWRGKPVWIVKRTPDMLDTLQKLSGNLRDPDSAESEQPEYATNAHRSIRPEIAVLIGICTHLGCSPTYRPDAAPAASWTGWPSRADFSLGAGRADGSWRTDIASITFVSLGARRASWSR